MPTIARRRQSSSPPFECDAHGSNSNANKLKFHNHNVQVLGPDHGATQALARASITMAKVDLWHARLAVKTLRRDKREAIAEVGE